MSITISVPKGLSGRKAAKRQNHATSVKPSVQVREEKGKKAGYALIEIKCGPDVHGPKKCIRCGKVFKKGEAWRRVWDPNHDYAIGVHDGCRE